MKLKCLQIKHLYPFDQENRCESIFFMQWIWHSPVREKYWICVPWFLSEPPVLFPGDWQMVIRRGYTHQSEPESIKEHSKHLLVYTVKLFRVALGQYMDEQDRTLSNNSWLRSWLGTSLKIVFEHYPAVKSKLLTTVSALKASFLCQLYSINEIKLKWIWSSGLREK